MFSLRPCEGLTKRSHQITSTSKRQVCQRRALKVSAAGGTDKRTRKLRGKCFVTKDVSNYAEIHDTLKLFEPLFSDSHAVIKLGLVKTECFRAEYRHWSDHPCWIPHIGAIQGGTPEYLSYPSLPPFSEPYAWKAIICHANSMRSAHGC